ncbi:type I-G CRISPR-associated protein, Cas3-extension family [Streptomyces qinglanensis]|uniref:type I-G CRISPR-associated protein, Cas3-extension family n=1 Tax=Streptomyces qinglanensis TaxID=943816 RepID=UPI0037A9D375
MLHPVELPALDGRDPLGFLASLGLVRILTHTEDDNDNVRLSFSDTTGAAILHSRFPDTNVVAERLVKVVGAAPDGTAIPGIDPRLPLVSGATGGDPMRPKLTDFRALARRTEEIDPHFTRHWLPYLVTDQAVDRNGRVALTPYMAPSGKQTVRTFFEKPLSLVRQTPEHLHEALIQWRRIPGVTGEYLDHRVLNSAADDPSGESLELGVPGATWLATMALPLLRLTGDGARVRATPWHRIARRPVMIWPLWREPLPLTGFRPLLDHPALRPDEKAPRDRPPSLNPTPWPLLTIFTASAAHRVPVPGRKSAGVLTPLTLNIQEPT